MSTGAVVVHAGAGVWPERSEAAAEACGRAAAAGVEVLRDGGTAVEAAIAAVVVLEDDPNCNAGTGTVPTSAGTVELDAAVMDGDSATSGAVACLQGYANPILVAEEMRREGRWYLFVGDGAARFAEDHRLGPPGPVLPRGAADLPTAGDPDDRGGTVGAVALDHLGHLAAATSTGGMWHKPPGRVGDTPIVGAGTYADAVAACSCTGQGEGFARALAAYRAVMSKDADVVDAADDVLRLVRDTYSATGGLILLRRDGTWAARHSTNLMPHAYSGIDGPIQSSVTDRIR